MELDTPREITAESFDHRCILIQRHTTAVYGIDRILTGARE
jgi:hypothetical protein